MRKLALLLLWLALGGAPLGAQSVGPPAVGRPAQFSGLVGQYRLEATAAPTTVHVEEPLTLRVRITGQGLAPRRAQLRLFPPDWEHDFYVEDVPGEDRLEPRQGTWEFAYRLRPKHERIQAIQGLKLVYYNPSRKHYETARQEEDIPLSVKPRPQPGTDWNVAAARAPASFYTLAAVDLAPTPAATRPSGAWLALLLVPSLLSYLVSRRWSRVEAAGPTSAAARHALQELDAGTEAAWLVVGRYLRERLGYPGAEPTPAEVARFFKRRGLARPVGEQAHSFYAACAAARFAPLADGDAGRLRADAARLIQAVESDRCLA